MSNLNIDPALARLIPEPTAEEKATLRASVEERGIYDPLVVAEIMGVTTLLDGHNRHALAQELDIPFELRIEESITDYAGAERWMLEHQLSRRSLNAAQRVKLALALEKHFAAEAKERMKAGVSDPTQNSVEGREHRETASKVAATANVSRDTVRKFKAVQAEAPPEIVEAVERGEKSIHAAYTETRPVKAIEPPPTPKPSRKRFSSDAERQAFVFKTLRALSNAHEALKGTKFAEQLLDAASKRIDALRTHSEFNRK